MIASNDHRQLTSRFKVLNETQIQKIHLATLEFLRRTGVRVMVPEVRNILAKAGCWIN